MAAAAAIVPWRSAAGGWSALVTPPPRRGIRVDDPDLKALTQQALDAATAAGASYADVRVTVTQTRQFSGSNNPEPLIDAPEDTEEVAVGVRALVQGAWGFMADTELTSEMMHWLGHTAATIGRAGAWPKCPPIELGVRPPAVVGHWQTPVKRDPFTVPEAEHYDVLQSLLDKSRRLVKGRGGVLVTFNYTRQERTFASTDGAFTTQTLYTTFSRGSSLDILLVDNASPRKLADFTVPIVSPRGGGFEVFEDERILDHVPEWVDIALQQPYAVSLPGSGQFEVVFDGDTMAALVRAMGTALEIDRALDYEASASGTTYLAPVEKVVGTTPFTHEVTVTANRTLPNGAATVRWDDEGVPVQEWPLIARGEVVDYATSREFVPPLATWYQRRGEPLRSRGCAGAGSALAAPLIRTPNLRLQPGSKDLRFEDLLAGLDDGFAVIGGYFTPDQQQLNLMGGRDGAIYRVKKGKVLFPIGDARFKIRVPDLWRQLVALGGERSTVMRGFTQHKGEPDQPTSFSVQAVPARFRDVVIQRVNVPNLQGLILSR